MNRTTRTVIIVIALLGAVATTAPAASAVGDGDGTKFCKRVGGLNACVAVDYGDCTLWASAGTGGCLTVPTEE